MIRSPIRSISFFGSGTQKSAPTTVPVDTATRRINKRNMNKIPTEKNSLPEIFDKHTKNPRLVSGFTTRTTVDNVNRLIKSTKLKHRIKTPKLAFSMYGSTVLAASSILSVLPSRRSRIVPISSLKPETSALTSGREKLCPLLAASFSRVAQPPVVALSSASDIVATKSTPSSTVSSIFTPTFDRLILSSRTPVTPFVAALKLPIAYNHPKQDTAIKTVKITTSALFPRLFFRQKPAKQIQGSQRIKIRINIAAPVAAPIT
mmetsp:Transcript_32033/g.69128  ORF Transcript_32033/g.69128 Transcript_32033/m.69128 type:complete len:261 (-) Transcript_32033:156-938(-)